MTTSQAAATIYARTDLGRTRERWAWINHVAYEALTSREQSAFVRAFLIYVRELNCIGVIEWTKGYYSPSAFYRAHFFPYFRAVDLYSWAFNPEQKPVCKAPWQSRSSGAVRRSV